MNGLGADFIRVCKIYHYCKQRKIQLFMDEQDDWAIVPFQVKNWRSLFQSLDMTSAEMETLSEPLLMNITNEKVSFDELSCVAKELFKPQPSFVYDLCKLDVVLHVRRGEKVSGSWKEGTFHSLDEYYDIVKSHYAPHQVYVMTDSPAVAKEACQREFMVSREEIRRDGFVYRHYHHPYTDEDLYDETCTFFKNISLLQHAEVVVGSNSSYFFVLGQLLKGRQGYSLSNNLSYYIFD